MKEKILEVLAKVNEDIVSYDGDNLFEAGILDSLQVVELVGALEEAFDIEIDAKDVVVEHFKTKEAIMDLMQMHSAFRSDF